MVKRNSTKQRAWRSKRGSYPFKYVQNVHRPSYQMLCCICLNVQYIHVHVFYTHIRTHTYIHILLLKESNSNHVYDHGFMKHQSAPYIHKGDFEASTCREYWSPKTRKFVYLLWLVRYSSFDGLNVSWQDSAHERCCLDIERKLKNGKNTSTIYITSNALIYVYIRTWFSIDGSAP